MAVYPTARNQAFRPLMVEMADWLLSPGGVYQSAPVSAAGNRINLTLAAGLNNAGVINAGGVLAFRMRDQLNKLIQGGDAATYRFEFKLYVRTPPAANSFPYAVIGLCPQGSAAAFTAAGTRASMCVGLSYNAVANPRPFTQYQALGGGATPFNTGVAGGYANMDEVFTEMPVKNGGGYISRAIHTWQSPPFTYAFDDSLNVQGTTFLGNPTTPPDAWRVFLGFGSFGGALAADQPMVIEAYYRAIRQSEPAPI